MPRMRTMNYLRDRLYRPGAQVDDRKSVPEARYMPGDEPPEGEGRIGAPNSRGATGGVDDDHRTRTRARRNGVPWTPYVWRGDTPDNIRRRREADAAFEEEDG